LEKQKIIARRMKEIAFLAGRWPLDIGLPTLVFIHGSGQRAGFWQAQLDGLTNAANTIALDLPGHGGSGGDGFPTVPGYAQAVIDFIKALEAPAPIPCGLSLGGAIVLQLLVDYGDRLKAGILANTGARLKVQPAIIENIQRDYEIHRKGLIQFGLAPDNQSNHEICSKTLENATEGPAITANDFRACDAFDAMPQVAKIDLPVLVTSAEHDILTPPKYADWLENNIPAARRVHINGAGHMSPIEQPDAFNAAITRFLKSLDL
jgi:pimeloyl-ACP methyl ester carboxylesterase